MSEYKFSCRPQDDLYTAVNGEYLKTLEIPEDRPTAGGFSDLSIGVEKTLMADFADFASGAKEIPDEYVGRAVEIYKKALDTERRAEVGLTPAAYDISLIESISSFSDLGKRYASLRSSHIALPFSISVDVDAKDSDHHCLGLNGPSTILPDTSYYADLESSGGAAMLQVYSQTAAALLSQVPGITAERAQEIVDLALKYDARIARIVKSSVEWADYIASYNPYTVEEASAELPGFDLAAIIDSIYHTSVSKIIVADPRFLKESGSILSDEALPEFKAWAELKSVQFWAGYASEEVRDLAGTYHRTIYGIKKSTSLEKFAYQLASQLYDQAVGIYYGRTYFGEAAKRDITEIVQDLVATYQKRITTREWLSPATREKAVLKLSTMKLKLAYPDKLDEETPHLKFHPESSLGQAVREIQDCHRIYSDSLLLEPVDRSVWVMPAWLVNACYNPTSNDLTFPAAILQAPFYSIEQSRAENLGGIGCVIGHEISHAFDNNGAQCDEKGNINNWWTEGDYANFKELTQAEIDQMDHLPLGEGFTNGTLIVSESIADNGGVGCALQVATESGITDLKPFFINYARIWCQKADAAYEQVLLNVDVHAPNYWRANIQPRNFPEFYTAFDVKPGDGMYLEPGKRVSIW